MNLIDTHTHLYLEDFQDDIAKVLERARVANIECFLLPAINSSYVEDMKALKTAFPKEIHLMSGLHPTSVDDSFEKELAVVSGLLKDEKNTYIAVGEIGIDLYWSTDFLQQQKEAFKTQIQWAKQYKLPIVIHCRNAFDEVFDILETEKEGLKGVFHCFSGNLSQAKKVVDYNLLLGIGGIVTYKNGGLNKFIDQIPLEHIVLETDSPYLSPTPFRGKRNESAYLTHILNALSSIYDISEEIIAAQTTKNAKNVFGLD